MFTWKKAVRKTVFSAAKAVMSGSEIRNYFATAAEPRLNIGCGKNILDGWLNTDIYPHFGATRMNAARRWPIPDKSLHVVFCEHMIEHVSKDTGVFILSEMHRTLAPGGLIRIVTPDLASFASMVLSENGDAGDYIDGLERFNGAAGLTICDAVNKIFYDHGHRYIYSSDELKHLIEEAGFSDLTIARGGKHHYPVFADTDGHPAIVGQRMNEIEAVAIEAIKPH